MLTCFNEVVGDIHVFGVKTVSTVSLFKNSSIAQSTSFPFLYDFAYIYVLLQTAVYAK